MLSGFCVANVLIFFNSMSSSQKRSYSLLSRIKWMDSFVPSQTENRFSQLQLANGLPTSSD